MAEIQQRKPLRSNLLAELGRELGITENYDIPKQLPKESPKDLPKHSPKLSPKVLSEKYGSIEPYNEENGGYNNNSNNNNKELDSFYQNFDLPIRDDIYEDSVENGEVFIPRLFWSATQKPLKDSEVRELLTRYKASKKMVATKAENADPTFKAMANVLLDAQALDRFDRPIDYKIMKSFIEKFRDQLAKIGASDKDIVEQFRGFLKQIEIKSPFHWRNALNFNYLDKNFNSIIRSL